MRLKDRAIIVTGAAAGIGRAYARRFLEEGAKVALVDVVDPAPAARELAALGPVEALVVDVADGAAAARMAARVVERFGGIDVLVNNAAVFATLVPTAFDEIDDAEWDRVMAVNVKGVWNCARAVAPAMKAKRAGRIINVTSPLFHKGTPKLMHYVASKGAVIGITRALARELGEFGVAVNAIAPGLTFSDTLLRNPAMHYQRDAVNQSRALKRDQLPADLEGTAVFLASDDSAFMTGQTLIVDGGSAMI